MYEETNKLHLDNRVKIEHDDNSFKQKFEEYKAELKTILGDDYIYLEHVGTTSVTDIMANPAIDIAISVTNEPRREGVAHQLVDSKKDYHIIKSRNNEILVRKGSPEKPKAYIHIAVTDGEYYKSMVRFAKELAVNPDARIAYQNVHIYAKDRYYHDPDKYYHAKSHFIKSAIGHHTVKYRDEKVHVKPIGERYKYKTVNPAIIKVCFFVIVFSVFYTLPWVTNRIEYLNATFSSVFSFSFAPAILFAVPSSVLLYSAVRERTHTFIEVLKWIFGGIGIIMALFNIIYGIFALL